MRILVDDCTIPLSVTTVSSGGTVRWMSPELLFGINSPPTYQSDCYALGMVIYEVRQFHSLRWPLIYLPQGPHWPSAVSLPRIICGSGRHRERKASQKATQRPILGFF